MRSDRSARATMTHDGDLFLGRPGAQLLLLGTFHFQDAGHDRYRPRFAVDILSEQRQREVADIVERLAAYRPTKIAAERTPAQQQELDETYDAYLRGALPLTGSEVHQIGFRLAQRLGHPHVYGVNAWDHHYEPQMDLDAYAAEHGQSHLLSTWWPRFEQLYAHGDRMKIEQSLRETLLAMNTEANILRGHGAYLVDAFKLGEGDAYPGADWRTGWYNRNLRIFANLQRITQADGDRLLLIIGAGHLPILRHCAQASPEYELVEVERYLGNRR